MATIKHSMFFPSELDRNQDIPAIAYGKDFLTFEELTESFDHSGEYYVIFRRNFAHEEIHLQIISFDKDTLNLKKKDVLIKRPVVPDTSKEDFHFEPESRKMVHSVTNFSPDEDEELKVSSVDLHYFYFDDDFLKKKDQEIFLDCNRKPDVTLKGYNELFNQVRVQQISQDKEVTKFMVLAHDRVSPFCPIGPMKYSGYCIIDFIHTSDHKIWSSQRVAFGLSDDSITLHRFPDVVCFKEKIYFFGDIRQEKKFMVCECDSRDGSQLNFYELNDCEYFQTFPECKDTLFVVSNSAKQSGLKRLVTFDEGEVNVLQEINMNERKHNYYHMDGIIKRLGRHYILYRVYRKTVHYLLVDFQTDELVAEIPLHISGAFFAFALNWNMTEFAYAFSENEKLFIKVSKNVHFTKDKISLKHFSRQAVLTSFSHEHLLKKNLPSSLFTYLGVEP